MTRAIDIFVTIFGLIIFCPIAVCLCWAIRLDSLGPAIFAQTRVGQNGAPFTCYKLRTMFVHTGDVPSHEVATGAITRTGRYLRATKFDELPQLYNVLRGDMSLVGPRPCLVSQSALVNARRKHGVLGCRPGVTGLAQVRGIDMSDPERLAKVDAEYCSNRSIALDFRVLCATFVGVRVCPV